MPKRDTARYFIVKHDLASFRALPGFIWRTGKGPGDVPRLFPRIRCGDRWVEFAYIKEENDRERCSVITGFYECVRTFWRGRIPRHKARAEYLPGWDWGEMAWMIEGREYREQPLEHQPVTVRPINDILGRRIFGRGAVIPGLDERDFERIRKETFNRQLSPATIPLLNRAPQNEQELLAVVIAAHKQLGIERIVRVRNAFPDLLVKIAGRAETVHLELEVYSEGFCAHGHDGQCCDHRFKEDGKPVAVLCWIHNEKNPKLKRCVHRVFELQDLLRRAKKIRW